MIEIDHYLHPDKYLFGKRVRLVCVVEEHGFIGDCLPSQEELIIGLHQQFFGCNARIRRFEYVPTMNVKGQQN